jgi:hypothetical protein
VVGSQVRRHHRGGGSPSKPQRVLTAPFSGCLILGDLAGALRSYRDSFAIADLFNLLVKSDPGAASWQYHLSKAYAKLAKAFRKAGDKVMALDALQKGRATILRLPSVPPHCKWEPDLSWFDGQIEELA